jgi:hypothetical protein
VKALAIVVAVIFGAAVFVAVVWQGPKWLEEHDPNSRDNFERWCVAFGGHVRDLDVEIQCWKHKKMLVRANE